MALKSANQPIRWLQRIGILILGLTANTAMVSVYDWFVYTYLLAAYGLLGWLYAVIGSIVLCLGTLWFYDITKQDWLGIETIKLVRDGQTTGRIKKFLQHIAHRGDVLAFLFLCIKYDAFVVTVYLRKGSGNYTMTARDWKIFWTSMIVSNVWWGMVIFGAIEAFKKWLVPLAPSFLLNWLGLA